MIDVIICEGVLWVGGESLVWGGGGAVRSCLPSTIIIQLTEQFHLSLAQSSATCCEGRRCMFGILN